MPDINDLFAELDFYQRMHTESPEQGEVAKRFAITRWLEAHDRELTEQASALFADSEAAIQRHITVIAERDAALSRVAELKAVARKLAMSVTMADPNWRLARAVLAGEHDG